MNRYITHLGGPSATILAGLVLVALGGHERRLGIAVLFANIASHLAVQILKRVVARPRPCGPDGRFLALIDLPDPYSFPSGHAAAAAAVAATVTLAHPLSGPLLIPAAAWVAASRVTLKVHHTVDAIAGAGLGVAGALLAQSLLL